MNVTKLKARWAAKLLRSTSFIVVTDSETVIFSEHTDASKFDDYLSAHMQLNALRKFQAALNRVTRDFDKELQARYPKPKANKNARKITVKSAK